MDQLARNEIDRKHSISAAVAFAEWKNTKINLIDTPGFGIFLMEARAALRVADAAAIVVSGVTGVEVTTEKVWKFADEYSLPRLVIVNKLDRERASFSRTLEALQKKFGKQIVPIQLPIGEEHAFSGVIDLDPSAVDVDVARKWQFDRMPFAVASCTTRALPPWSKYSLENMKSPAWEPSETCHPVDGIPEYV